jgi:hypothetical protein
MVVALFYFVHCWIGRSHSPCKKGVRMNVDIQKIVYIRDGRQCIRCTKHVDFHQAYFDRIRNDPFPGYDSLDNIVTLCETCYLLRNIAWEDVPFFQTYLAIKYAK